MSKELTTYCPSCRIPSVAGCGCGPITTVASLPLLVRKPEAHLLTTYRELVRVERSFEDRLQYLRQVLSRGQREEIIQRTIVAFEHNLALRRSLRAALPIKAGQLGDFSAGHRPPPPNLSLPGTLGYIADVLDYLKQDWAGTTEGEETIQTMRGAIVDVLDRVETPRGTAIVVGAGTGRIAWELSSVFERVIAVDLSLLMALLFERARENEVEFYEVHERGVFRASDSIRHHRARVPVDPSRDLTYWIADALDLPVPDGSIDAIVSAYFTDVVPLSRFLPEAARVLRPGGSFIHFGPLGWHFQNPDEMWAADELPPLFAAQGMPIETESWIDTRLCPSATRMANLTLRAWCFGARKI